MWALLGKANQIVAPVGLSRDQKRDALRIAKIPDKEFVAAAESEDLLTVTALAARDMVQTEHRLISNVATGRQTPRRTVSSVDELGLTKTLASSTQSVSRVVIEVGTSGAGGVKTGISRVGGVRDR